MFQSLLSWIGRVNCMPGIGSSDVPVFQSLLSWIGRVNGLMPYGDELLGV